jgi:HlyD family secretion protein
MTQAEAPSAVSDANNTPSHRSKVLLAVVAAAVAITGIFLVRGIFRPAFRYAGTLEATRIDLPARLATVVQAVEVHEGDKVTQGQRLASLACEDTRINAKLADENYRRGVQLKRSGSIAQEGFDQLSSRKQESDTRLSWCEIVSPVKGTVLNRFLEPGEWVNPGTKIVSVADLDDMWAYIYVPQPVMARLKTGTEVEGVIPELGDRRFRGVIRKINDEAEFTPKNVQTEAERTRLVFGVKVAFKNGENTNEILKPGMTIEVELPEGERK